MSVMFAAFMCGGCAPLHIPSSPVDDSCRITVSSSDLRIAYRGDTAQLNRSYLHQWIIDSATAIQRYYGHFPVPHLNIVINGVEGRGAQSGTTFAYNGALIRIAIGRISDAADVGRDWIMTHEMVHLTFPRLSEQHIWLEEGVATYVEPIARAQVGQLTDETVWTDMMDGMPKGLPARGDRGLDNTHTWGRTYWGGALFCLLADVRIREHTSNRRGLRDALRGILAAGGSHAAIWDIRHALTIGDQATGTTVLVDQYEEMRAQPVKLDLAQLWQRLGVKRTESGAQFDDTAPLAPVRRAITHDQSS